MAQTLDDVLGRIQRLEPLPTVATRVLALAAREDVLPRELTAVIRTDAALCTRVLRLCNSAYYGFRREIATLQEAGVCLGVARLSSLVLTVCAGRWFQGQSGVDPRAAQRMWRRNVANALGARALARLSGAEADAERAYTAGLLQNLGETVLERHFGAQRTEIDRARGRGFEALAAERSAFGADHAEIGARLVARWDLPELLVEAIRWHHEPIQALCHPHLAALVHLSERIALASERADLTPIQADDPVLAIAEVELEHVLMLARGLDAELTRAGELAAIA